MRVYRYAVGFVAVLSPALAYRIDVSQKLVDWVAQGPSHWSGASAIVQEASAFPGEKPEALVAKGEERHPVHEFDWARVFSRQVAGCCAVLFLSGILVSA